MSAERPPSCFELRESLPARAATEVFRTSFSWFELTYYCLCERLKISAPLEGRAVGEPRAGRRVMAIASPDNTHVLQTAFEIAGNVVTIRALMISEL